MEYDDCETTKTRGDGMVAAIETFISGMKVRSVDESRKEVLITIPKQEQFVGKQSGV